MAYTVLVPGASEIALNSGGANATEKLGYSMNGVEIRFEVFKTHIPGDQNGGDLGPPIEKQVFARKAIVRIELSRFDAAVARKLDARINQLTPGPEPAIGQLLYATGGHFKLGINNVNDPYTFYNATPIEEPHEVNVGSRWQRRVYVFECLPDPISTNPTFGQLYALAGLS
jgi:hypothetical protein